ncbi:MULTISPECIES: cytochrome ubiquinol oxidase subunit I [unclassified Mucilaginibacter]|uniref:cytochrome ubiquinol oxidase subunit I n=1 Tax=unclassified Mucilaginibacter TaxID=2617802 RepID=UPI00096656F0|nr:MULTISPECIES: cytochrome ubiquinol oxidase subunit I [unclassified Mucilaginibacter]OJW15913.1 MAG: cytochrome ubiquinol oxidase subunit I [Mucilaginibacter sp. 44-25]PLW90513.1 MAG: cytochrome ubiquinol oxidase subunit I [Mucilaginibacter sp.]PMP64559.1 MAG: cytochrome ubiquinol oxidase subunit I [Mucilaginibacter sp.]HEK21662.1 cytochrome ubiquinol oxidase subunit I [Bacteroidota bacterium]
MDNFMAARSQMALSLGFHIIFSCIGMVMPFFMAVSHFLWLRKGEQVYQNITRAWSKGVAIFFATGAVSGTVLSFELGLLWPTFMKHAGPIFGMPFSLEGTAFFIEAIALGFYLYGWKRFNRWFHWVTGLVVGISGLTSGILVVAANSWMNSPAGFDLVNGQYINIDPIKAMFNPAWFSQALHMCIAAFAATGFAVAGVHALMIWRNRNVDFHMRSFKIAAIFGVIAALLQPLSGDISAKMVAKRQPAKLAAMEAHFKTEAYSPLILGGIPDEKNKKVDYAIELPGMLSFLVYDNFKTPVKGLDQIPQQDQPPVTVTHFAFQIMVGLGIAMMAIGAIYLLALWKKRNWFKKGWFLKLFIAATPLGFIAVEAGWTVTEVGRQPWIIQGVMRTADAVTPMPGIHYSFYLFAAVYFTLSIVVIFLLYRQIKMVPVMYDVKPKNLHTN